MTNFINISHGHAFDEMDICETSNSYEDFLTEPIKCALNEAEEPEARRISTGSNQSNTTPTFNAIAIQSSYVVTDGYSDLFEEYDVLPGILGTGHYGCVRECQSRSTGQKYAVKTIDKSKVGRLDHIQREIELLRSVNHPGIMTMVDCFEDANYVHIVTEKYTGGELFDEIVNNTTDYGCLDEAQAARIIKSLLEAVQYLHSKDIVHRDIKPENILFETNEEGAGIKLIDFGLARTHGVKEGMMSNPVGTPYYMSPDVLKHKYDRSCDLWAVGIVSYILLSGYPPFNGSTDYQVQDSILKGKVVFEKDVWSNLSKASQDFVSMLLCKDSSKSATAEEALQHPWIAGA